jgi:hypothetical protein
MLSYSVFQTKWRTTTEAEAKFQDVLRLSEMLEPRLQLGPLFKLDSELVVTEGASETLDCP